MRMLTVGILYVSCVLLARSSHPAVRTSLPRHPRAVRKPRMLRFRLIADIGRTSGPRISLARSRRREERGGSRDEPTSPSSRQRSAGPGHGGASAPPSWRSASAAPVCRRGPAAVSHSGLQPALLRRDGPGPLFRGVWVCACSGLGRLISLAGVGSPSHRLLGFTVLEVIGAPLLIYWQHRVALSHR